jgi:hypothetical protein
MYMPVLNYGSVSADVSVPGMFQNPQLETIQNTPFKGGYIFKRTRLPRTKSNRKYTRRTKSNRKYTRRTKGGKSRKSKKKKSCGCNKIPFF